MKNTREVLNQMYATLTEIHNKSDNKHNANLHSKNYFNHNFNKDLHVML